MAKPKPLGGTILITEGGVRGVSAGAKAYFTHNLPKKLPVPYPIHNRTSVNIPFRALKQILLLGKLGEFERRRISHPDGNISFEIVEVPSKKKIGGRLR